MSDHIRLAHAPNPTREKELLYGTESKELVTKDCVRRRPRRAVGATVQRKRKASRSKRRLSFNQHGKLAKPCMQATNKKKSSLASVLALVASPPSHLLLF